MVIAILCPDETDGKTAKASSGRCGCSLARGQQPAGRRPRRWRRPPAEPAVAVAWKSGHR